MRALAWRMPSASPRHAMPDRQRAVLSRGVRHLIRAGAGGRQAGAAPAAARDPWGRGQCGSAVGRLRDGFRQPCATYLHREQDGTLIELPLAWYSKDGGHWGMNPGFDSAQPMTRRKVAYECMFCHNAYPATPRVAHRDVSASPVYSGALPEGIDCMRCHGTSSGAAAHILAAQTDAPVAQIRAAILNPARLHPGRSMQVASSVTWRRPATRCRTAFATSTGSLSATRRTSLGDATRRAGDVAGAILEYRAALQVDPPSSRAGRRVGTTLVSAGKTEEARAVFDAVLTHEPDNALVWYERGLVDLESNDATRALLDSRKALVFQPDLADAQNSWDPCWRRPGTRRLRTLHSARHLLSTLTTRQRERTMRGCSPPRETGSRQHFNGRRQSSWSRRGQRRTWTWR